MLDPTLDLEADLGVDSIKRIEILGALGERLGLAQDGEGEAMVEELAMMKSLGEMTSWLHAKLSTPNTTDSEEGERPKAEGERLPRAQRVWVSSPLNNITNTHEMSELSHELVGELPHELLERALDEPFTLIHLSSEGDEAKERAELLIIPSYRELLTDPHDLPLRLLALIQKAWLAEHTIPPQSLLVVAPHPRNTQESLALGGLNGFIKTLWREFPILKVRLVWLEEPEEGVYRGSVWREPIGLEWRSLRAQEIAELPIISRWSPEEGRGLARSVERYEPRVLSAHSSASQSPAPHTPHTQQGALLVTGGARGITAHCVRALPHLKGRLVLLCGRSPAPTHRSELWTRCEASLQALSDELWRGEERALKRALAEALPELERAELGALIKEGQARREISEQLSTLEDQGAIARYLSVDVSDAEALAQAVHEALREASREGEPSLEISDVLHGAGVIEDKKLKDKRLESFERVWRVKVEGARALLRVAPHAQRWVFFSSVSSALGNQGQVDYASANAALDALAEALCAEGRDALSLQWGPWGGAGMVSDVLARYYARSGVKLIELEQGLEAFAEEWTANSGTRDACITLRSWPFER
jgi:NAD(P)-dependent dehydrogenase (short-subunit alcohol dehydrogenase family)